MVNSKIVVWGLDLAACTPKLEDFHDYILNEELHSSICFRKMFLPLELKKKPFQYRSDKLKNASWSVTKQGCFSYILNTF